jgi:nucleoside-diphosphate-sugar epimerase
MNPQIWARFPRSETWLVAIVSALRVLFIGGSGVISSACCRLAVRRGIDVYALNRGATQVRPLPSEVTILHADIRDQVSVREALGDLEFDVVVNWVAFMPEHIEADLDRFRGRIRQYVFISSTSVYEKPPARVPVTESTPLRNPYWQYAWNKPLARTD